MCGRRGTALPPPSRELSSSHLLHWECCSFFSPFNSRGPASSYCGRAKHPLPLHPRPWPPLISQEFILFTDQSAGRLNARVCRPVSPAPARGVRWDQPVAGALSSMLLKPLLIQLCVLRSPPQYGGGRNFLRDFIVQDRKTKCLGRISTNKCRFVRP